MTPQHDYLAARKPTKLVVGLVHTAADPGDEFLSRSRPASELCCVTISIPVAQQQLTLHKKTHSMVIELASSLLLLLLRFLLRAQECKSSSSSSSSCLQKSLCATM